MAEVEVVVEQKEAEVVAPANPFDDSKWNAVPALKQEAVVDPVIKEKDEKIKEEKPTSDKPNEPEKIPGATPPPIQDKPKEEPAKPTETSVAEPLKFANEESEKIFNLIKEGKEEDVYKYLHEKQTLKSVDKLSPADIIKLNLQYQNKDFSAEDINDLFSERYSIPEKPEQLLDETDEDFKGRMAKHEKEVEKVENRVKRDAKPAKTELLSLQKEIVLPDIPKDVPPSKGLSQEELDEIAKRRENYLKSVDGGVKAFNGYSTTYKDEEVEIPVTYPVSEEQKSQMKSLLENFNMDAYFEKRWIAEDGSFNTKQLSEDIHLLENRDAIFQKLVSETGNRRHEASIKSIKNIDYSGRPASNGDTGETPQQKGEKLAKHFFSA
jgi:hypothetical protein